MTPIRQVAAVVTGCESIRQAWVVRCALMRHLARRAFAYCSAASLLLFVAACVLWVASDGGRRPRFVRASPGASHYEVALVDGWITVYWVTPPVMRAAPPTLPPGVFMAPVSN